MTARRFFLGLAFTALALGLLIPILWGVWIYRERARIKAAETRIQTEGLPVTLKDVFSSHVASEDNAAPLLEEVKVKHQALKESGFTMRLPGSGSPGTDTAFLDSVQLEELKSQMASPEVQVVLDLLREASRKPAAQFDRDYSKGAATDIKAVPMILYGAQLLNLSAWLRAQDGDIHGAMEDILSIARLARLGLDDPMTISWLVGMSADLIGFSGVQLVLSKTPPGQIPLEQLQELSRDWAARAAEARQRFLRALDAERLIMDEWMFRTVYPPRLFQGGLRIFSPIAIMDRRVYLEAMLSLRDRARTLPPGDLPSDDSDILKNIPRLAFLTKMSVGALGNMRTRLDEYQTSLQLAQVGVALEEWRARHTEYPATLAELGLPPDLLRDPFSGKPLVYHPTSEGVTLYSLGANRKDDGGVRGKNRRSGDIIWSVQRSPAP